MIASGIRRTAMWQEHGQAQDVEKPVFYHSSTDSVGRTTAITFERNVLG